jgi:hypothetical protein
VGNGGRFLIRLCDLVGAPRGRFGPFFCLPGRGGHLGGPATKWGGRERPAGHAAVPRATGGAALASAPSRATGGVFFFQGGTRRDKLLDRSGGVRRFWTRKN